ncbi:hypothetical protein A3E49_03005 [Candidatus Saccharibacteria bacterium RIFCSPHIGHO2_12_FULL_49_19]|nr:MAG: hypothetical protein A2708_00520 [Candidatus Saccharibacteria bacterium RIFCSPHIGHO2_01_FULL_49_21]OGL36345.1 MAG: hypothetical protein A3E49_03005 [Candidatus Saccharibacteria bacterium RIFCSPHIGHO2_12_FULL_49_19]OGL37248.1 MAG: hypothetical protein A3B63_01880 [Candidatus Saccharibacteria bacterium RIFCSPLOWO2_01_FULL_49_22]
MTNNQMDPAGFQYGGVAFVGCAAVGAGIGLLNNELLAGLLIGGGLGFVLMALIAAAHQK